ncbi:MarR family winged helix-turn-helix transcriptional regulator [Streptomyces diastatochromogenes]|uniref:MarR family transcriptional regulator n=1 Tax=Streptomyces diastatochromogenes TaxID=42236 RepID=A0A233S3Q0_STRDA|nr:MarR family transcriptional regulator [Streptomyces diastatochromogenes]MCZ0985733.1 MarR family transcriptional regulator [Streptomyces diastatochromogenes]OXY90306.1 MarR family transcriptional regulator [Streptomyces diastatochromogenes]
MPPTSESIQGRTDAVPTAAEAPLGEALFRAARVHRIVAGNLLRETGLYPGQELLMMQLWEHGEQRQADLIKTLGLDPSTVTKMLQRLEQSGFVTRKPSDRDRRAVVVSATRAGQALRDRVQQVWRDLETITTDGFTDEECDRAMRLLARIDANLNGTSPTAVADPRTTVDQ